MKRAAVKPQFEFRAAVRRHLACYRLEHVPSSRVEQLPRNIIYIDASHRRRFVIPFLPSALCHGCTAVLVPGDRPGARLSLYRGTEDASFARPSRKTW